MRLSYASAFLPVFLGKKMCLLSQLQLHGLCELHVYTLHYWDTRKQ